MNVCMILSTPLPPREGIGFYAWNLSKQLTRRGHQLHLITRGGPRPTTREQVEGITIWRPTFFPMHPLHVHFHSLFVNSLVKRLDSEIDLYHLHTPLVSVPPTLRPVFVTVHTALKADSKGISTKNIPGYLARLQVPVSILLEHALFKRADQLAAVARSVAGELSEYEVVPKSVLVLGNGADTGFFRPAKTQRPSDVPYFLTAGRLGLRKGLEDLLLCARIVIRQRPDVQFWIAGEGPLRGELERSITRLGLAGRVRLLGHIEERAELAALYQGALGYIHPAHYEGLPTVLLEAMACGCPAVATAVSGALDVIEDGVNGLLVPPRDPQGLAAAVVRLLGEPALAQRLGRAARRTIEERYSWEAVGSNYLAEYHRLVNGAYP